MKRVLMLLWFGGCAATGAVLGYRYAFDIDWPVIGLALLTTGLLLGALLGWQFGRKFGFEEGVTSARAYWDEVMRQRFWGER